MRPRWHKILADLLSHKVRSLLVIASIAVGLFAIGMITTSYVIMAEEIRSGYRAINPANIQVSAAWFNDDFVEHIANLPGVDQAEGVASLNLQVHTGAGEWDPISIRAQTYANGPQNAIARVTLLEGIWPPEDKQIVLEFNRIEDTGAALGDDLEIKLPSGTIRKLRIVGIVQDQTIGSSAGDGGFFLAGIQGYVNVDTLAWLEQPEGYNTLYLTVGAGQQDRAAIQAVADQVVEEFEDSGYTTRGSIVRLSEQHPNLSYVDAMAAVIFLLGFLVVFLSGFLITNTLSALLNQQVTQIGVMKTIGASRRQIIGLYMVLILVFSAIALVIAVPLSNQAAYAMLEFIASRINFRVTQFYYVPASTLLQVVIALVVPQVAGSAPILQGTRISVREALSGTASMLGENTGLVYRLLSRVRGISRPMLISLRNTLRRRVRLLLTLITLTLGGAMFIATFNVRYSIEGYVDRLSRYFLADVNLTLARPYRTDRVVRDVMQVPGVRQVEGWSGAVANFVRDDGNLGNTLRIIAPPANSKLIEPNLLKGRWLLPEDQNAITLSELSETDFPDLDVGDTIRLKIGQKESDWVIVGFFQFAGPSSGIIGYVNYEYLAQQTGTYGRSASFRIVAADTLDRAGQEQLGRQVEAHMAALGYEISEVSEGLAIQKNTSEGLNILTTFLLIMSFLMASVGSIGLMGMMSLNVMERTREIGVMRAIGGSNQAIISIVLLEGVLVGLFSWLLACLVALPISKQFADVMFQIIFARSADLVVTISGSLIWLGIVVLLSVFASVVPAYNASRLTIREVLAYE